jgi:diguanylate cyclase
MPRAPRGQSTARVFLTYATVALLLVAALGFALASSYRTEAQRRGVDEGRAEARLVARTAIEPILNGRSLNSPLLPTEIQQLRMLVRNAISSHDVLRLRLRNLSGNVVFSDDGSGFKQRPEDEAIDAVHGLTVARLTQLNADANDSGPIGPRVVEVYLPLGTPAHRLGVLEIYLPYGPISADLGAGLAGLYRDLAVGLGALYVALFGISWSVTRRLRRELHLNAYLAEHDLLTSLPNRTMFQERATVALEEAARNNGAVAVAIIDLDRFKEVNDTLGHGSGDALLAELARRLVGELDRDDTVARLGGDEFGLVLRDGTGADTALWRIRGLLERAFDVGGVSLCVDASIGYAIAEHGRDNVEALLQHAEVAMYAAKERHAGITRYEASLDRYDAANLSLASELRHAIDAGELILHYQPKARMDDLAVDAVEALVRWQHPTLGLLAPDRFVPLAEQSDLIDRLTEWVLRQALDDVAGLQTTESRICVAVNVSARNLGRRGLSELVERELARTGLAPDALVIEMTETALLADPTSAARVLNELRALGVHVSIDDFGSGQTSLGYVSTLPIDELKIDRSFIESMQDRPADAAIVRSIVELGHNLGLRVVAEGVETDEAFFAVRATGCDLVQGFLVARPMDIQAIAVWLAKHRAAAHRLARLATALAPA